MSCRVCGATVDPDLDLLRRLGKSRTATSHARCLYRCQCGAGYSNNRRPAERTLIWASPELNVPVEVRDRLDETLALACNFLNRRNKWAKFCFETSEDAVTWTIFRAMERSKVFSALVAPDRPLGEASLVLWGVPIAGPRAEVIGSVLAEISRDLGEVDDRRTEPDAIVVWDGLSVVVEAKYENGNVPQPGYEHFPRYLDRQFSNAAPTTSRPPATTSS